MEIDLKFRILNEIDRKKLFAFTAKDFLEFGSGKTINKVLERLEKNKEIKRIITGVYYIPKYIKFLDDYEEPNIHEVAKALSRKYNWSISPTGNSALNKLGLSTQVPSKYIFLSSGGYKKYNIKNTKLEFKRTSNREILNCSLDTNLIIQSLKALGRGNVEEGHLDKIKSIIDEGKKNSILKEAKSSNIWIYEEIKKIWKDD